MNIARLAQSDRASDSYRRVNPLISEGCEFDPRGGLKVNFLLICARALPSFGV